MRYRSIENARLLSILPITFSHCMVAAPDENTQFTVPQTAQ
jgi:hypothetical protein